MTTTYEELTEDWEPADFGDEEYVPGCPACGDPIDYCQGHGSIGDPYGYMLLQEHDRGNHAQCHPGGCDDAEA